MRKIDKSKKSNIKCEHCKKWKKDDWENGVCQNNASVHYNHTRKYFCRCKHFEWAEEE